MFDMMIISTSGKPVTGVGTSRRETDILWYRHNFPDSLNNSIPYTTQRLQYVSAFLHLGWPLLFFFLISSTAPGARQCAGNLKMKHLTVSDRERVREKERETPFSGTRFRDGHLSA